MNKQFLIRKNNLISGSDIIEMEKNSWKTNSHGCSFGEDGEIHSSENPIYKLASKVVTASLSEMIAAVRKSVDMCNMPFIQVWNCWYVLQAVYRWYKVVA